MTRRRFYPEFINDSVARPHYVVIAQSGNNIMAPLFLPSLNIFRRDKGKHVNMTTGAASATGNISTFFHGSLPGTRLIKIPFSVAVKGEFFFSWSLAPSPVPQGSCGPGIVNAFHADCPPSSLYRLYFPCAETMVCSEKNNLRSFAG